MAEIILRIIGALIEGLIDGVFESTGRKVLSHWGMKSNPFVEILIGIVLGGRLSVAGCADLRGLCSLTV
jgi:hypothetical protein